MFVSKEVKVELVVLCCPSGRVESSRSSCLFVCLFVCVVCIRLSLSVCSYLNYLVELLVVSDRELNVPGNDSCSFVVTSGVAGKLQNLSGQVLEHSGEVHRGT